MKFLRAMPVLERPTESTVELIPSFKRLNAVQDCFAIDERTVTLGTDQRWRWRFRGACPETACFHVRAIPVSGGDEARTALD
jgi:hypothetical protein